MSNMQQINEQEAKELNEHSHVDMQSLALWFQLGGKQALSDKEHERQHILKYSYEVRDGSTSGAVHA
mgnify:CR=1 FL=1